jgi:hypothetical protein
MIQFICFIFFIRAEVAGVVECMVLCCACYTAHAQNHKSVLLAQKRGNSAVREGQKPSAQRVDRYTNVTARRTNRERKRILARKPMSPAPIPILSNLSTSLPPPLGLTRIAAGCLPAAQFPLRLRAPAPFAAALVERLTQRPFLSTEQRQGRLAVGESP